ncbi:hypothetical protein OPV22_015768 [Ensete ventricosum]|uniref:Uncharacterized protein n=1 Tax=Ensete ventricosum TaxID=4639 RepID=A0AAV8R0V6_ENSVE|nr:hypothetical protein OPV22_015768 [Ensete ventricosum]
MRRSRAEKWHLGDSFLLGWEGHQISRLIHCCCCLCYNSADLMPNLLLYQKKSFQIQWNPDPAHKIAEGGVVR